jgi:hypothetical protein
MTENPLRKVLFAVTVLYGLVVALLAALEVDALGPVAAVGAVVIGLGWGCSGSFARHKPRP